MLIKLIVHMVPPDSQYDFIMNHYLLDAGFRIVIMIIHETLLAALKNTPHHIQPI